MLEEPGTVLSAEEQNSPDPENKEQLSAAKLEVHIDKDRLKELKNLGLRPQLQELVDTLGRLPENLNFQPGVTLILGDNASGKSTLAKAIRFRTIEVGKRKELEVGNDNDDDLTRFGPQMTSEEIEEAAHDAVFGTYSKGPMAIFELRRDGLAPNIAQALTVDAEASLSGETQFSANSGLSTEYIESPLILAEANEGTLGFGGGSSFDTRHLTEETKNTGSHRQTINRVFEELAREKEKEQDKPKVYFLDEPETGLSPRRHLKLQEQLDSVIIPGSIAVVPTNSTVLYKSDLPRIDLDFPERGIFRPSQYPQDQQ